MKQNQQTAATTRKWTFQERKEICTLRKFKWNEKIKSTKKKKTNQMILLYRIFKKKKNWEIFIRVCVIELKSGRSTRKKFPQPLRQQQKQYKQLHYIAKKLNLRCEIEVFETVLSFLEFIGTKNH